MTSFERFSFLDSKPRKVAFILMLFAIPLMSPPSQDNPQEALLPGGPTTVQAGGFPTIDIGQIFGHLAKFSQGLEMINNARKKYSLIRDNFKKVQDLGEAFGVDLAGLTGVRQVMAPANNFLDKYGGAINLASNAMDPERFKELEDEYMNYTVGDLQPGSIANKAVSAAGLDGEQSSKDIVKQMGKNLWKNPGVVNKKLERIRTQMDNAKQCIDEASKGSQTMHQCRASLEHAMGEQMSMLNTQIMKQTAYIAGRGLNDEMTKNHRLRILNAINQNARDQVTSDAETEYRDVVR